MPIELQFHPEAREEYLDAVAWYLTHSNTIARAFQQEVDKALEQIRSGPARWPVFEGQVRWIRLHRFPYVLYYEGASTGLVNILAVAHARRRPGYWRTRRQG
jgi:plasmid stabilization system protein ParE